MNIHEYQAKQILGRFGVPVPKGQFATTPEEAAAAFTALGQPKAVVKAQIHAGGRGKAGGVKLLTSATRRPRLRRQAARQAAGDASDGAGRPRRAPHVYRGGERHRARALPWDAGRSESGNGFRDREHRGRHGYRGSRLEDARKNSHRADQSATRRVRFPGAENCVCAGLKDKQVGQFVDAAAALYRAFIETDASLIEINPLVVTKDGRVICLDAKMSFDDNALFRHPDIRELRDANEEDPAETEAAKYDLSYVHLDGNIGCMVNGAGLAMATMDIVKIYGAEPANFLDVGGGASTEKVAAAFRILLADKRVKGVLINIFGGIMRCDVLAQGRRRGGQAGEAQRAAGGQDGRHQRGRGQKDSGRVRYQGDCRQPTWPTPPSAS